MSIQHIIDATGAVLVAGPSGHDVTGTCRIDSREVGTGDLFVAFPGERVDGNAYVPAAVASGAACVVMTCEASFELVASAEDAGCAILRAAEDDPTEFLLRLAGDVRAAHEWLVVGITGSVGKTTTKDLLARALGVRYRVHATAGNFNNLIGVPLTILGAPDDAEVLVVEMGMNHTGEIDRLSACGRPQLAVVTNVGTSHIGLLGSREAIARAKGEIVGNMTAAPSLGVPRPKLFLGGEDDFTQLITTECAVPAGVDVQLVGTSDKDAVRTSGVELDDGGCASFSIAFPDGWSSRVSLSIPGRHVVADAAFALAVADELSVDREAVVEAVSSMPAASMRLEVKSAPGCPRVIDDSYNASPNSMAAALDVLCEMACEGRRIAVLGEMGELGTEEARLHEFVGVYAAAKPLDLLVLIGGELAGDMWDAARLMGMSDDRMERFDTVQAALDALAPVFSEGDLVLVKASRASGLDVFAKGVLDR